MKMDKQPNANKTINRGCDVLVYQHYPRMKREKYHTMRTLEIQERFIDVKVKHIPQGMVDFILLQGEMP